MTIETTVIRFALGAEVPPWLIDQEPIHTQSKCGVFRFATACDVIDAPDYFMVVPVATGPLPSIIDFDGQGVRIFAAGKPVRLVCAQMAFMTPEVDAWAPTLPWLEQKAEAPRRKGLWARLFG